MWRFPTLPWIWYTCSTDNLPCHVRFSECIDPSIHPSIHPSITTSLINGWTSLNYNKQKQSQEIEYFGYVRYAAEASSSSLHLNRMDRDALTSLCAPNIGPKCNKPQVISRFGIFAYFFQALTVHMYLDNLQLACAWSVTNSVVGLIGLCVYV